MKRIFKIFAAMLMIGTLCGCGEGSENNTAEIPPETEVGKTLFIFGV